MSSKLKLKGTAGGSMSFVIDDTLVTDETFEVPASGVYSKDEIDASAHGITNGGSGDSFYTKFPDGTLICRGTLISLNGYRIADSSYRTITYAHAFIAIPSTTMTLSRGADDIYDLFVRGGAIRNLTQFNAAHGGISGINTEMSYVAIGRWK